MKNRTTIWPSNPTTGHTPRENHNSKRHMHPNVHCSTIYNSQAWMQPKCPLTEEWMKKMWYIYTMEYYSAIKKNEIMPFAATWMDLEIIILSEVRKRKTRIIWYLEYMWNLKKWYKWTFLQIRNRFTDFKNLLMVTKGEGLGGRDKLGVWDQQGNSTQYSVITYMGKESKKERICIYV